jgi:SAM-dependent methyltransferase
MAHWENSDISSRYSTFRPKYPSALFDGLVETMTKHGSPMQTLVDVGCGTGQALEPLLGKFERAVGVDPSASQVAACEKYTRDVVRNQKLNTQVSAVVGNASAFNLPADVGAVDLVTVAQAMHWFDMRAFGAELQRVLRPGGYFAAITYLTPRLEPQGCDAVLQDLDRFLMANEYWPRERKHVDNEYINLIPQVPFPLVAKVEYNSVETRSVDSVVQYISTWSGLNQYVAKTGHKTRLDELRAAFKANMGDAQLLTIRVPMRLFVFRKPIGAKL